MGQINPDEAAFKAKNGDIEAFGIVYDAYIERIYRFVYYKTHHKETAEDVTSEVFRKALQGIGAFDPAKGSLSGWLYRIARNAVIDHYRSARPTDAIDDMWDLAVDSDAVRDIDAKLAAEDLQRHLSALTAEQRDIVLMRVWEGMSYREIADALGKSEAACKMAFMRGIGRLRGSMGLAAFLLAITGWL